MESKVVKFVEAQNRMCKGEMESQWSKDTKVSVIQNCSKNLHKYTYSSIQYSPCSLYYRIVYLNFKGKPHIIYYNNSNNNNRGRKKL